MSDLLTDEQLADIRTEHGICGGVRLGKMLAHYDATVERHAEELGHANSNADNLRVELADARATRDRAQAAATAELERRRLVEACFARYREGVEKLRADLFAILEAT